MAAAQYRILQLAFSPEKWQVDTWTDAGWTFVGTYSSEAAAQAAIADLVPRPLPPPIFFDAAAQPTIPDPAQTDEIKGV